MNLQRAKFCVNCDEVFFGAGGCPKCGGESSWVWLARWLNRAADPGVLASNNA